MIKHRILKALPIALLLTIATTSIAFAQDEITAETVAYAIDNITLMIAAVLVLFMQAGFAMVEAGFNASKNTVNILFKNLMDMAVGGLLYFLVGYGIMYGSDITGALGSWLGVVLALAGPRPTRSPVV